MKKLIVPMIVVLMMALSGGCIIPDAQQIQSFADDTKLLTEKIDDYQKVVVEVKNLAERDKLISEKTSRKLDKISEEVDRVQPHITEIADAVKNADYISGDDIGNALKAAQAANAASAPVNPYAPLINVGLGLIATIAAGFGAKKTVDANKATTRLARTNEGISKFGGLSDPDVASKLHDTIKEKVTNL